MQLYDHRIVGHYIGHVHGKHVGPLLFQKGSALSLALGLLKLLPGLLLLLDPGSDQPVPDLHGHAVYAGFGGCGKDIFGIDGSLSLIGIGLGYIGICNDPVDLGGYLCFLQGKTVRIRIRPFHEKVGSQGFVRVILLFHAINRPGLGQDKEQRKKYTQPFLFHLHLDTSFVL